MILTLSCLADGFKSIMRVSGQEVKPPAKIGINPNGSLFWHSSYEIVIQFGLTEMKAYYAWEEDVSPYLPF